MAPLLQADGVGMSFGGVHALSGVSFELHQGETLGLIGPNGAGKTTMFNCITGVLPGYRGHIYYDGRDLRKLKPHQRARLRIARTFQNLELFDELSALDNLLLPLDAFSRRGLFGDLLRLPTAVFEERKAQEKARAILHVIGLGDEADTPAGDLPVGLQRRLEIGRALCLEPRLLLFDELSALDNLLLPLDAFSRRGLFGDLLRLPTSVFEERKAQEKARAVLHVIGLGDEADTPAGDLPVGLQRRLEIGRALCLEPRLLLLDEPAAGLDARETAELARLLALVRARFDVTMLIVDHDMALIMRVCNRIYVLDYGQMLAEGPPEQIRDDPNVVRAYLGDPAGATA